MSVKRMITREAKAAVDIVIEETLAGLRLQRNAANEQLVAIAKAEGELLKLQGRLENLVEQEPKE